MPKKILFVGMPESLHAARWISQILDFGWDLHFFSVYRAEAHPLLRDVTLYTPYIKLGPRAAIKSLLAYPYKMLRRGTAPAVLSTDIRKQAILPIPVVKPFDRLIESVRTRRLGESGATAPLLYGPWMLAHLIRKLKPDLIHSMEFQHAGYNVLRARDLIGETHFPKWLATNWGSDIYYYQQFPDHRLQISRLLKAIDFYSCECERDVSLARDLGLSAPTLPVLPNTGGFDLSKARDARKRIPPSKRKILMVKGYQHFAGRAVTALDAVARCADVLKNFHVVIFSAFSPEVQERVTDLRILHGVTASILDYSSHERMLRYYAHARAYIGVSLSDGISTSMLEAMAMGAFPIQTDTSCCREWFVDGETGFSVPHDDVQIIADRLRQALTQDELVDNAATKNWKIIEERVDQTKLKSQIKDFYLQTNLRAE